MFLVWNDKEDELESETIRSTLQDKIRKPVQTLE